MFKRLTPSEGIAALEDRVFLEASILASTPDKPDASFRVPRQVRRVLLDAAERGLISDGTVSTPPAYELRGTPSLFFLTRN